MTVSHWTFVGKCNFQLSRHLNAIKCYQVGSCVRWANGEQTGVSSALSVFVIREVTDSDAFRVVIYLPEPLARIWWREKGVSRLVTKQLLCLYLVFVHHHAVGRRPSLAQCGGAISTNIVLVQAYFGCFLLYEAVQASF